MLKLNNFRRGNMVVDDFKITIKAKKVPVDISNIEIIKYVEDNSTKNSHLACKVF